jgi:imidazolonepropionase-like amidohydrolase
MIRTLVALAAPFVVAAVLAVVVPALAVPIEAQVPPRQIIAIEGVTVIPMDGERVLADHTVVVQDGRIVAVGPASQVRAPDDAVRVAGAGRYLIPGLPEMHGHLPGGDAPQQLVEDVLFLYVANGVTLVRGMQGHPRQLEIREAVRRGEVLGPRLILAGPALWGSVPTPEAARAEVRSQAEAGYDLLKMGEGIEPAVYDALMASAREVGIPVAGHVPDAVGLFRALEAGQVTIDHLDNYVEELVPSADRGGIPALWGVARVADRADESRIPALVSATRDAGAAVVPTMVLWEVFFGDRSGAELRAERSEVRYMPPGVVDAWERAVDNRLAGMAEFADGARRVVALRRQIMQALHEGGVTILQGTDSPQLFSVPGFATQREMEHWVGLGMTPYEVLRTGTWNVAEHLGELDEAGTIAVGKRADMVLLEANPLTDIRNAARRAGVVVDGRWLPRDEIERRLEAIAARHAGIDGSPAP